jgi:Uma2 family endonuclease
VANNTKHYELIATTKSGLEKAFADREDVFVAADLFWYPVKGNPKIAVAPDVMVAFGRPKGDRKSYKQWEEENTPFHVVFEFLSDSNTPNEMTKKAMFFDRHGVEEYYLYDMEFGYLSGFVRYGGEMQMIEPNLDGWVSPRLGIRFEVEWSGGKPGFGVPELVIFHADGTRFRSYLELDAELQTTKSERDKATSERDKVTSERDKATSERDKATSELRAERERTRLLEAKLREMGVNLE